MDPDSSDNAPLGAIMVRPRANFRGEQGQALIEYAVIIALVGACVVVILGLVGRAAKNVYDDMAMAVSDAPKGGQWTGASGGTIVVRTPVQSRGNGGPATPPPDSASAETPPDSVSMGEPLETGAAAATAGK